MGLWGEELQAPWDLLKEAGHELTLATPTGIERECLENRHQVVFH